MRKIFKYTLALMDEQVVMLPAGAMILSVQTQGEGEYPQLWALVDPDRPKEARTIRVYGTGHGIEAGTLDYISTFQMHDGGLVFHAFEVRS